MRIVSLTIDNIGPIERASVSFPPEGMVLISGDIGSGKSTVLGAIYWLITGRVPDAHKTKDRFRRVAGTEQPKPSGAVGVFRLRDDREVTISGRLDTSAWSLAVDGQEPITDVGLIAQAKKTLFGVDVDLLRRYGFVQQGGLRDLLYADDADRTAALMRLIGIEQLEPVRETLRGVAERIDAPDLSEMIVREEAEVTELTAQVDGVRGQINEATGILAGLDEAADRLLLRRRDEAQTAAGQLRLLEDQLSSLKQQQAAAETAVGEAGNVLAQWQRVLTEREPAGREARQNLATQNELQRQHARYLEQRTRLDQALAAEPSFEEQRPDVDAELAACREQRPAAQTEAGTKRSAANDYRGAKLGKCPVCGQPCAACLSHTGPRDPQRQAELDNDAAAAESALQELESRIQSLENQAAGYEKRLSAFKAAQEAWSSQVTALRDFMSGLPSEAPDAERVVQWQAAEASWQEAVKAVTQCEVALQNRQENLSAVTQQLTSITEQTEAVRQAVAAMPAMSEVTAAETRIKLYEQQVARREPLMAVLSTLDRSLQEKTASCEAHRACNAKNGKLREYRRVLEKIRQVLHRDRLPNRVLQGYLKTIVAQCEVFLEEFSAGFTVFLRDGDFYARKVDGTEIPTLDLSGGEACKWCISFLAAVQRIFARDLGLLVMDEPTYGLNRAHLEYFASLLQRFPELVTGEGTQIIVSSHEPSLRAAVDHEIKVPGDVGK